MYLLYKLKLIKNLIDAYLFIFINLINKKKIICFDIFEIGYIEHIIEYIKIAEIIPEISICITTQSSNIKKKEILSIGHKIINYRILRFFYGVNIFITPQVHIKKPPRAYKIHVFHNQPIKYISFPKNLLIDIDEHFVWSPLMESWVKNMLFNHGLRSKITRIGNPRLDKELFSNKNKILKEIWSAKNTFKVGYAPSWDPYLSLRSNGIKIIKKISSLNKSHILLRLHPCSLVDKNNENFELYTGGINWFEKISSLNLPNVSFVNQITTIDYLKNIDVLVTDVSSISLEALLMDIPVVFYESSKYWDPKFNNLYKQYTFPNSNLENPKNNILINGGRCYGKVVNSLNNLVDTLKEINMGIDPYSESRKTFKSQLIYNKNLSKIYFKERLLKILKIQNN